MRAKILAAVSTAIFIEHPFSKSAVLSAETGQDRIVRLAELQIDPTQVDAYKASLLARKSRSPCALSQAS